MITISFRTKKFVDKDFPEGQYRGEDVARWLALELRGWKTEVSEEDWGWAVYSAKDKFRYNFGVYDYELNDVTEIGPKWRLHLYNERDWWTALKGLFRHRYPKAHAEVIDEIFGILRSHPEIREIQVDQPK